MDQWPSLEIAGPDLADGVLKPVIILLSHVYFGADYDLPDIPSLRGLFVDYPGRRVRPPLSASCERCFFNQPGTPATSKNSVRVTPGQRAITVTPRSRTSAHNASLKWSMYALVAA